MATDGCKRACLNTAGRGGIIEGGTLTERDVRRGIRNQIQEARRLRTRAYFEHRDSFMARLAIEISRAIKRAQAQGYVPVFRLNGTSDIRWESVPVGGFANIMAMFSDVQFYDYTKLPNRKNIPTNYHLTFSLAESNDTFAIAAMANGMNVAAVFRNQETVARYVANGMVLGETRPVVRGDDTDLRFLDASGHVVALYAKGNGRRDRSGFVRD
jgi:hypothetical protein